MGTLVQPPGCFPFYSSTQFSTLPLRIDKAILAASSQRYTELERMMDLYKAYDAEMQKQSKSQAFTAIMNVLTYHPVVAKKISFNQIKDRHDVEVTSSAQVLDCTNHVVNYFNILEGDEPTYRVDFAPNMLGAAPTRSALFCGKTRLPGPLFGQWSTALGAMGQVLQPHNQMDVSSNVTGCVAQCNSTYYFARYHAVPKLFVLLFQYSPTSVQLTSAYLFEFTMRLLAITGLTLVCFDHAEYCRIPHQSPEQNFGVIDERWAWYSTETKYDGPDAHFPCPFSKLPGVPTCFSFSWMKEARGKLRMRMAVFFALLVLIVSASFDLPIILDYL